MFWRFSTVLCVSLLAFSCVGMASASWYITDLGAPVAGGNSWAYDLTSSGAIVGGGDNTAFTWSNGTMTNLGAPAGFSNATGYGINDAGTVVGIGINNSTYQYQGLCYQGGQWYPLAASTYSAQKVYDNGTIVGVSNNGSGGFGAGSRADRRSRRNVQHPGLRRRRRLCHEPHRDVCGWVGGRKRSQLERRCGVVQCRIVAIRDAAGRVFIR